MKARISPQESEHRWKTLLRIEKLSTTTKTRPETANDEDPFDCSSIAAPPTQIVVDRILNEHVQRWKELDQRKIIVQNNNTIEEDDASDTQKQPGDSEDGQLGPFEQGDDADDDDADGTASRPKKRNRPAHQRGGWRYSDRCLRLPDHFDYATKLEAPPEDDGKGDRVISLLDPSRHLSYSEELWKLFATVPTVDEIEEEQTRFVNLPHSTKIYKEITEGTQQNARLDGHSLSRLRSSDRHGLPPANGEPNTATIRLECWRRQPKRGPSPDANRLVMEFLSSQTLMDVHNSLVELMEDDLWAQSTEQDDKEETSGFFFIEDTFYTAGAVDYVSPITQWIDGGGPPNPARRRFLGIFSMEPLKVKRMSETRLDQIQFRLGTRYHHVHHGDVEIAVFCVDMRLTSHANVPYPILHDIWCPSYPTPQCEACQQHPALFVTSTTCAITDGGPRALCDACCCQLKVTDEAPNSILLYSVWRNEQDLSSGASQEQYY
jgi:hypothetical protein